MYTWRCTATGKSAASGVHWYFLFSISWQITCFTSESFSLYISSCLNGWGSYHASVSPRGTTLGNAEHRVGGGGSHLGLKPIFGGTFRLVCRPFVQYKIDYLAKYIHQKCSSYMIGSEKLLSLGMLTCPYMFMGSTVPLFRNKRFYTLTNLMKLIWRMRVIVKSRDIRLTQTVSHPHLFIITSDTHQKPSQMEQLPPQIPTKASVTPRSFTTSRPMNNPYMSQPPIVSSPTSQMFGSLAYGIPFPLPTYYWKSTTRGQWQ